MNQPNEPHGLNRFIELDRMTTVTPSIESIETRLQRVQRLIGAAVDGITKRGKRHVRFNRN